MYRLQDIDRAMSSSQVLICKAIAGRLAFVCTMLRTLEVSHSAHLPSFRTIGVNLGRIVPRCVQVAEENQLVKRRLLRSKVSDDKAREVVGAAQ